MPTSQDKTTKPLQKKTNLAFRKEEYQYNKLTDQIYDKFLSSYFR